VLNFGGGTTGITYSTQTGKYWKIGPVVYFNVSITLTNKGSSTGAANITGLPFTSANDGFFMFDSLSTIASLPASTTQFYAYIAPATSTLVLGAQGSANQTGLTNANFANNTYLTITGFYWVS